MVSPLAQKVSEFVMSEYIRTDAAPVRKATVAKAVGTNAKSLNTALDELGGDFNEVEVEVEYHGQYSNFTGPKYKKSPAVVPSRRLLVARLRATGQFDSPALG